MATTKPFAFSQTKPLYAELMNVINKTITNNINPYSNSEVRILVFLLCSLTDFSKAKKLIRDDLSEADMKYIITKLEYRQDVKRALSEYDSYLPPADNDTSLLPYIYSCGILANQEEFYSIFDRKADVYEEEVDKCIKTLNEVYDMDYDHDTSVVEGMSIKAKILRKDYLMNNLSRFSRDESNILQISTMEQLVENIFHNILYRGIVPIYKFIPEDEVPF